MSEEYDNYDNEGNQPQDGKNLENTTFDDKLERISSPRSLEACKLSGVDIGSLYKLSYKEFLNLNPDYKYLDHELQKLRYDHYDEKRMELVILCIEKRKELIEQNPEKSSLKNKHERSGSLNNSNNRESTVIKLEQEKLERLKKKQVILFLFVYFMF